MVKEDLVKRSPLRLLERSSHGGVKAGELGVIASRKGVGKTAVLVHLATDSLFQGKHVIHVSFAGRTDHIISWYEDIFHEIKNARKLDEAVEVHDELVKNRVIMNFNQEGTNADQILSSLRAMIEQGGFAADMLAIDGFDFSKADRSVVESFKGFAQELGLSLWFTATTHREDPEPDERGVPDRLRNVVDNIAVLITLSPEDSYAALKLVKDHDSYVGGEDLHLKLDPRTMLIIADE